MDKRLRGRTAIVGLGYAGLGHSAGWSSIELLARATHLALADAGLSISDVDGLCAGTFYHFFPTLSVAEYLGIRPLWSNADMVGGSSFMSHILQAALAIEAGLCNIVVIAYGSNARSSRNLNGICEVPIFESLYAPPIPLTGYALAASRHMHCYGTTRRQLAEVAVAARQWAQMNPDATLRSPLTIEDALAAPMIADPFARHDCCLISDGAAAIVVTSADRARDLAHAPVYVLGAAAAHSHREIAQMSDLTVTAAVESGQRAYAMARVSPREVDLAQVYDAFTINTILFMEDLGFCPKGEGGHFVSDGGIAPGGRFPVNTSGGGLAFVHPGLFGLFCIGEAVIQLRRQAGARQVIKADLAVAHGNGGTLSHQCTTVLGTANTI